MFVMYHRKYNWDEAALTNQEFTQKNVQQRCWCGCSL